MTSSAFHLVCAAAASDARALRDLRSLCNGLPAAELVGERAIERGAPPSASLADAANPEVASDAFGIAAAELCDLALLLSCVISRC